MNNEYEYDYEYEYETLKVPQAALRITTYAIYATYAI